MLSSGFRAYHDAEGVLLPSIRLFQPATHMLNQPGFFFGEPTLNGIPDGHPSRYYPGLTLLNFAF